MINIFSMFSTNRLPKEELSLSKKTDENVPSKPTKSRRWQMMDKTFEWKMVWVFLIGIAMCLFTQTAISASGDNLHETEAFFRREKEVRVPVIMYHLVTENSRYIGKYGIRPSELRSDFEYLKENGYNTVVIKDLVEFVENGKALPPNPIVLTFDDGNFSDYKFLLPLLKEFEMTAVISIMGATTDKITRQYAENPNGTYPNLTWCQVVQLHESGLVEVQSHGFDVHKKAGAGKVKGESAQAYHERLKADLLKLEERCMEHLGYKPNTFCFPYGIMSKESHAVLEEMGYKASLSCQEDINIIRQGESGDLYKLNRVNRASGRSIGSILKMLEQKKK